MTGTLTASHATAAELDVTQKSRIRPARRQSSTSGPNDTSG